MLALFKRENTFLSFLLIITSCSLLHFLLPNTVASFEWDNSVLLHNTPNINPFYYRLTSFVLILLQTYLVFVITNAVRQIETYSLFYTWLFVWLIHAIPYFFIFSPVLLANTLLLFCIYLFYSNIESNSPTYIFYIGFILGICYLIWIPSMLFFIFFVVVFFQYNKLSFKTFNILLVSSIVPLINFYFIYFLLNHKIPLINLKFAFNYKENLSLLHFVPTVVLIAFVAIGMYNANLLSKKINQAGRLFLNLVLSALIIFLFLILASSGYLLTNLVVLCFPLAVYLGMAVNIFKRPIIAELIHLTIILCAIVNCLIYSY